MLNPFSENKLGKKTYSDSLQIKKKEMVPQLMSSLFYGESTVEPVL